MGFFFLILLTATIFIRPAELFDALRGLEIYLYLIVPCLLLSFQAVLVQLSSRNMQSQPIMYFVLMFLLGVFLSELAHFDIDGILTDGWAFTKNIIYYVLLISLVNTPERLKQLLFWIWFFSLCYIILILLQYNGLITLHIATEAMSDSYVSATGEKLLVSRMTGSGIFTDPNDICTVIITGFVLSLYGIAGHFFWLPRVLFVASSLVYCYALQQTQSRSGFMGLAVAGGTLLLARYGWKTGAKLLVVAIPLVLPLLGGRLTNISTQEGTAQTRFGLWRDGLQYFKGSPIFGIGISKYQLFTESHHAAHNAYVTALVETGLFGSTFFNGAFFLTLWTMYRLGNARTEIADQNLQQMQPFMMALTAGISFLLISLSQTYYISTYMILGLLTAYMQLSKASNIFRDIRVGSTLMKRIGLANLSFALVMYIFTRIFI